MRRSLRLSNRISQQGYYSPKPGLGISEITHNWADKGQKIFDESMPINIPLNELWKYRDYSWTRDTARPSDVPGTENWDRIKESLKENGFTSPVMVYVGKDGKAKVAEGNHRLAIAKELGIDSIPTKFFFTSRVTDTYPGLSRSPRSVL